jgi:hypothetical protein
MMHHPCLLEKVVSLASKTPLEQEKNFFINFKFYDLGNECVKFGKHEDRQVNYEILQLIVPNNAQTLHNPPCF